MKALDDMNPHNKEAFQEITKMLEKGVSKLVASRATGSGKTYLMAALAEQYNDAKKLVLEPSNPLLDSIKDDFAKFGIMNTDFMTYQKLIRLSDEDISELGYKLIFLDECHHCAAPVWGEKIQHLMDTHLDSVFFGTSATSVRSDGVNVIDVLFDGNVVGELPLSTAIAKGILPVPVYVTALYRLDDELEKLRKKVEGSTNTKDEKKEYLDKIKDMKSHFEKSYGVPIILNKYIKEKSGKYLVFCKDKKHLDAMRDVVLDWFRTAGIKDIHSYVIYSDYPDKEKDYKGFLADNSNALKVLFCINMLNEGLHIKDISGVVMIRPTMSNIVYRQQLGRVLEVGNLGKHPLVIDLVNNFSSVSVGIGLLKEIKDAVANEKENNPKFDDKGFVDIDTFFVTDQIMEIQGMFAEIEGMLGGTWDKKVDECINFYNTNGRLPNKKSEYMEERILGYFLINCKSQIKNNPYYSDYKKQRLEKIPTFLERTNITFNRFCKYLKEMKQMGRATDITARYIYNNYKVGQDYMALRKQYKDGKLNSREIDEIRECGVDITLSKEEMRFKNKMQLLKEALSNGRVITRTNPKYKNVDLYGWYRWNKNNFTEEELKIANQVICNSQKIPIKIIDIKTGDIFYFSSINEAGKSLHNKFNIAKSEGSAVTSIHNRLIGHIKNPIYKHRFRFEYADNETAHKLCISKDRRR